MVNPSEYGQWYYLIYLLPGGVALLLLSGLGGGMHHHHGLGHHGGHGLEHHGAGHHAPAAHGHAPSHTPAQAHGQARGAGAASRTPPSLTAFFGLGRVPAPLVWGSALLGWGLFGFWGTQFWESRLPLAAAFALPALATALVGALVTQKVTVEAASRLLPRDESYAVGSVELCGLTGTAVFAVDNARGRVHEAKSIWMGRPFGASDNGQAADYWRAFL